MFCRDAILARVTMKPCAAWKTVHLYQIWTRERARRTSPRLRTSSPYRAMLSLSIGLTLASDDGAISNAISVSIQERSYHAAPAAEACG